MKKPILIIYLFNLIYTAASAGGSIVVAGAFAVVSPPCDGVESMLGWNGDLSYVGDRYALSVGGGAGSSSPGEPFDGLPGETRYDRFWLSAGAGLRVGTVAAFDIYPTVLFSYGKSKQYGLYNGYFKYPEYHYGSTKTDIENRESSFLFGFAFGRYGASWPTLHLMFGVGWRQNAEKGLLVKTGKVLGDEYNDVFVVDEWNYDMVVGMRLYGMLPMFGPVGITAVFEGVVAPRDEVFVEWDQEIFKKRVAVGRDITVWIGPSVAF